MAPRARRLAGLRNPKNLTVRRGPRPGAAPPGGVQGFPIIRRPAPTVGHSSTYPCWFAAARPLKGALIGRRPPPPAWMALILPTVPGPAAGAGVVSAQRTIPYSRTALLAPKHHPIK